MTKKNELTTSNQAAMMSSREIATLTGKNHADVCRDIRTMLSALYGGEDKDYIRKADLLYLTNQGVECIQYDKSNSNAWEYNLNRRHTEVLISGYDVVRRAAIIDRWFDLESGKTIPVIQQQSGLSKLEVLQMAIESEQGRLEEKARADKAERTKSQISRSREAQALGKLSAATRKCRELEERLGESTKHATVTAVQNATEKEYNYAPLRKWCRENDIEVVKVPDTRYGHVKSWPAEAWLAIHGVDLKKLFGKK
ncbi:Rha family transcriptional regulator [Xenorhabdus sp. XENO-1]|uniref:Rha family transcriptional regulator n=1 Tax=Xenorhabdus bovienii TaxID=40576 RepID=UPI0020CA56C3|nr:Rha family transcriptional regulator [Xenorhabdus bovienii]MCP9270349.1 Rha family transcriptional regulator [Xenorhabdus bovienii subsp. africana]